MTAQIITINADQAAPLQLPHMLDRPDDENFQLLKELTRALELSELSEEFIKALPYKLKEYELVDVLNVIARLGCSVDSLRLRICEIDERLLPCLFVDDKTRRLRVICKALKEGSTGTAYFFNKIGQKEIQAEIEEREASGRGWCITTLIRYRRLFWQVLGISFALNLVSLGLPVFLMIIYDRVADITTAQTIYELGLGATILLAIEWVLRRLRSRGLSWFAVRFDNVISNSILSRLLQLPAKAIERASVASQLSRLKSFETLREFFTGPLFLTLLDLPFTLVALGLLAVISGSMVFVPIAAIIVFCALLLFFHPRLEFSMFQAARSRSNAQTHQIELIEKLQALRLNGMSEIWLDQFRDISAQGSIERFRSQYLSQALETIVHAVALLTGLAVIYIGVTRVWEGTLSGGALFASILLVWRILGPVQTICGNIPRLLQMRKTTHQIDRLMDIATERENAPGLAKLSKVEGRVSFSRVGLRYNKESDPVFTGLSFSVEPGELIAITGGNGSGKSTILKLILGLYRPQAGAVFIDDRDIRQIDPILIRKKLAYIPQHPEMFEGTIADNIRLANPSASDEQLWQALQLANIENDVANLPFGLETQISGDGRMLSTSLSFRIGMARAFVKDAPILLADELPYAVLNSPTGDQFIKNLKQWHGHKTIIMVSHRDDHIAISDRAIGLLDSGGAVVGAPYKIIKKLYLDAQSNVRRFA